MEERRKGKLLAENERKYLREISKKWKLISRS